MVFHLGMRVVMPNEGLTSCHPPEDANAGGFTAPATVSYCVLNPIEQPLPAEPTLS